MSVVDEALANVYEKLVTKPDWIVLVSHDGVFVGHYKFDLENDKISDMLVTLYNCNQAILTYTGSKNRDINFAVGGYNDSSIAIFVIGEARFILGMSFSHQITFSELSILEKGLPTALLPLSEVFDLD